MSADRNRTTDSICALEPFDSFWQQRLAVQPPAVSCLPRELHSIGHGLFYGLLMWHRGQPTFVAPGALPRKSAKLDKIHRKQRAIQRLDANTPHPGRTA